MKKLWITMALLAPILCLFVACGKGTPDSATEDSTTTASHAFMAELPNEAPLSALVLPGTHDSGATVDMVLPGTAKCQSLTIGEQLSIGVRFFDIRLRRVEGSLHVYHGEVDQKLSFDEVAEIKWLSFEELKALVYSDRFVPHDPSYKQFVIDMLSNV